MLLVLESMGLGVVSEQTNNVYWPRDDCLVMGQ